MTLDHIRFPPIDLQKSTLETEKSCLRKQMIHFLSGKISIWFLRSRFHHIIAGKVEKLRASRKVLLEMSQKIKCEKKLKDVSSNNYFKKHRKRVPLTSHTKHSQITFWWVAHCFPVYYFSFCKFLTTYSYEIKSLMNKSGGFDEYFPWYKSWWIKNFIRNPIRSIRERLCCTGKLSTNRIFKFERWFLLWASGENRQQNRLIKIHINTLTISRIIFEFS